MIDSARQSVRAIRTAGIIPGLCPSPQRNKRSALCLAQPKQGESHVNNMRM